MFCLYLGPGGMPKASQSRRARLWQGIGPNRSTSTCFMPFLTFCTAVLCDNRIYYPYMFERHISLCESDTMSLCATETFSLWRRANVCAPQGIASVWHRGSLRDRGIVSVRCEHTHTHTHTQAVMHGAGGMDLIDPLFQNVLASAAKARKVCVCVCVCV